MGDLNFPPQDKPIEVAEAPGWAKFGSGAIIVATILAVMYLSAYFVGLGLLQSGVVRPTDHLNVNVFYSEPTQKEKP